MQKLMPCLWFDTRAEEAAEFYASIFEDAKIITVSRYGDAGAEASGKPKGSVMTVLFEIAGQRFLGLNGGPNFTFSPAVSFMVHCASQDEVDTKWAKLSEGGEPGQCGWLTDKFGLSWQIVPTAMDEMMQAGDAGQRERVMAALIQMTKIDIGALQKAFDGE